MNCLVWNEKSKWLSDFNLYAKHVFTKDLQGYLLDSPPEQCWSDDVSWLPNYQFVEDLMIWLRTYFSHVKAYHSCSPLSVKSYYSKGIIGQDHTSIEIEFKRIFSDINEEHLDQAIQTRKCNILSC